MRILIVRRDNIGDLVCTTPLFTALRRRYPNAWIGALVNSYNAPVLQFNADLNEVIAYTKLKHLESGQSPWRALRVKLSSFWKLRRMQLDFVVLATSDFSPRLLRLAQWLAPKQIVGFSDESPAARALHLSVPIAKVAGLHEVERVFALARLLDLQTEIPPLTLTPDETELHKARAAFGARPGTLNLAVHISARRPAQRWPSERFTALIERLHAVHGATSMVLWSPGPADHPQHPGDDDKAKEILRAFGERRFVVPYRTDHLGQLIGALAASDAVICSDGGAMHVAAALRKPIIALFGDSSPDRWRPWGPEHQVLRAASRTVRDIAVGDVADAAAELLERMKDELLRSRIGI